jgi:tetrahydromethanopterin:alpha-L-glutamate ligase
VKGAMVRHGSSWINNVAQGGRCELLSPGGDVAQLALEAAKAVDIDYCGVDIIRDRKGRLFVLEVNSIPAWKGLQGVVGMDIAQALVDDFLGKIENRIDGLTLAP